MPCHRDQEYGNYTVYTVTGTRKLRKLRNRTLAIASILFLVEGNGSFANRLGNKLEERSNVMRASCRFSIREYFCKIFSIRRCITVAIKGRHYLLFVGCAHDQDFGRYIAGIPDFYVLSHRILSFDYYLYFMLWLCYNYCLSFMLIGICRTLRFL